MKNKRSGHRVITLILIFICVALVFAAAWGITSALAKLTAYSQQTTISREETPLYPEQETSDGPEQTDSQTEEEEALPRNTYSADGFYETDGIRRYHGGDIEGIAGIDVSSYQQQIDWAAVRDAGIEFALIRVGYRGYVTGELDLDDYFVQNIEGALEAGLQVGVYFFSQALTPEEAVEEADYVLEQIQGYDIQYPVFFDWEEVEAQARTDEMNMLMLTSCAQAFCQRIEEAGYRAGIYFYQQLGYQQLNLLSLKDYVFWLAEYADAPTFVYEVALWQYTNTGSVPGIEGSVDMNIAFRNRNEN